MTQAKQMLAGASAPAGALQDGSAASVHRVVLRVCAELHGLRRCLPRGVRRRDAGGVYSGGVWTAAMLCAGAGRILSRSKEFSPQVAGVRPCKPAHRLAGLARRGMRPGAAYPSRALCVFCSPKIIAADANRRAQGSCLMTCNDWRLDLRLARRSSPRHLQGWVQFGRRVRRHGASCSIGEVYQEFFACPSRTTRVWVDEGLMSGWTGWISTTPS